MINDPCERCTAPYGHKGTCPTIIRNASIKAQAEADWQRGKMQAEKDESTTDADEANAHYQLGRSYQEADAKGLIPKRRRRAIRVPVQSEPRLAAVTSITRSSS